MPPDDAVPPTPDSAFASLAERPGFLIRRLHQIHLALFAEECGPAVTPVQFSVMTVAAAQPGLDQMALGGEVGVDRTTLASVLKRLEQRGLCKRVQGTQDRRLKHVALTAKGRKLLAAVSAPAQRAHQRTVEALPPAQRAAFLQAMLVLIEAGNESGRARLRMT